MEQKPQQVTMLIGQTEAPQPFTKTLPGEYLVAMCDVLGFSNFVRTHPLEHVYNEFLGMRARLRSSQNMVGFQPRVPTPVSVLDGVVFSDTIMLWAPATGAMEVLPMNLCLLVAASLSSMPLRVGIAFGECVIDSRNDIFIGQPIIDAYQTEQRQEWFGGAYHPSCWKLPGFRDRLEYMGTAVKWEVPLKPEDKGPPLTHALNWPRMAEFALQTNPTTVLSEQEKMAPGKDKPKWQNACAFFQAQPAQ